MKRSKPFNFKLLSYNIHQGISVRRHKLSLSLLKQAISGLDADVVVLQEVAGNSLKDSGRNGSKVVAYQLEELADKLWPHFAYGKNAVYSHGYHGNAILSKYPIVSWNKEDITCRKMIRRSLLHAILMPPELDSPIHIIGVHLGLVQYERRLQIKKLCHYVSKEVQKENPLFLAGDFNDWRRQVSRTLSSILSMKEVFKHQNGKYAKTFPSKLPFLNLDRIYFRGGTLKGVKSPKGKPWTGLSDHLPVLANFVIS